MKINIIKEFEYYKDSVNDVRLLLKTNYGVIYDDFDEPFNKLIRKAKYSRISGKDLSEIKELCFDYWENLIKEVSFPMKDRIKSVKTKNQSFLDILLKIQEIEKDVEKNPHTIEEYQQIYENTIDLALKLSDRLEVEKFQNKRYWQGIWLSGLTGTIIGLIIGYLLNILVIILSSIYR
ncbi:hypothetical protein HYY72_05280 [Candidatus Woesearchaeota archaeon]|nr:hypothetical protein [Candidatus Woesearchaeota archaeon]